MTAILGIVGLSFFIGAAISALYFQLRLNKLEAKHVRQLRLRRNLLNAMSNQLREPLNELFPQVQMLSRLGSAEPEKRQKLSSGITKSVKAVSAVLENLTQIIESLDGKGPKARDIFDIDALLRTAVEDCCPPGFNLVFSPAETHDCGALLTGNADELKRAVDALLQHCAGVSMDNSLKLSREVRKQGKQNFLEIAVELNNLVLSKELQKYYFDFSFSEANPHLKGRPSSLVGLFLAHESARRAGGALEIVQAGPSSVRFRYCMPVGVNREAIPEAETASAPPSYEPQAAELPAYADEPAEHMPEVRRLANSKPGLLTDKTVLIVDDVETNRLILEEMLRTMGLTAVVHASRGQESVDYCEQMKFDLVFMDIQMPDMDGLKATELIRAMGGRNRSIPVIAVTAASRIVTEELCLKSGMNGYLEKPLSFEAIRDVLRRVSHKLAAA